MSIKKRERKLKVVYEGKMDMELDKKFGGLWSLLGGNGTARALIE